VAAFHLAMGPDDCLYVAAPTLATHDAIYRITPDRLVGVVGDALGRPQGLAFDEAGALYVVDALAGAAGLYRIDVGRAAAPELVLSAPALVGVAFDPRCGLVVASADTVWRIDCPLKPWRRRAA
jgi:sugar lactone lactonase YvrE